MSESYKYVRAVQSRMISDLGGEKKTRKLAPELATDDVVSAWLNHWSDENWELVSLSTWRGQGEGSFTVYHVVFKQVYPDMKGL